MVKWFKRLLPALLVAVIIGYMVSCNLNRNAPVALDVALTPFQKLSDYNFFSGTMSDLLPNTRVIPYDLITPLFTDYAHKARFVYVPDGKTAEYRSEERRVGK